MSPTRLTAVTCLLLTVLLAASVFADESYNVPFNLVAGTSTPVGDEGMVIGFDEILEDSRCPTGVWCFWPGNAAADLWLDIPDCPRQEFVLNTYYDYDQYIDLCLVVVTLIAVNPYPDIDEPPIEPGDYVVTLLVDRSGPTPYHSQTWGELKALYR